MSPILLEFPILEPSQLTEYGSQSQGVQPIIVADRLVAEWQPSPAACEVENAQVEN